MVAGLEPEKTNQFLQQLAHCASDHSLDFCEAVRMSLEGVVPNFDGIPRTKIRSELENEVDVGFGLEKERPSSEMPPSRAGARSANGESKDLEPPSRLGGMGIGISGLDEQIEACDGSPDTTLKLLEPIITRPKLTDKLLGKPPFRFLHDIISEVIKQTSFASGLYDTTESDSSKVTDKNAKITYLAKLVKLVGIQLNTIVEARPTKIVSGLEPNNTNRLLQLFAVAASFAPNSDHAVRAVLASGEFQGCRPAVPSSLEIKCDVMPVEEKQGLAGETTSNVGSKSYDDAKTGGKTSPVSKDEDPPQSKLSARPTTARRRPPIYKDHLVEDNHGPKLERNTTIMVDIIDDDDNDGDHDDGNTICNASNTKVLVATNDVVVAADGKSKLVREIQEEERAAARRGFEEIGQSSGGIRFGRIDHATTGSKDKVHETDLNEIQRTVQVLCQSTNPIAKCMDYVHEDVATMHAELKKWEQELKLQVSQFEQEIEFTRGATRPLDRKLKELDEHISNEEKCVRSVKARILNQEERMSQLLRMISTTNSKG